MCKATTKNDTLPQPVYKIRRENSGRREIAYRGFAKAGRQDPKVVFSLLPPHSFFVISAYNARIAFS